jgi:predicted ribosome quality control (RQC) complex YloA/Tae2 family protein
VRQAKEEHLDFIGFIGKTRQKTSVQPRSFLTPEAIGNLADYLETLGKKGDLPKTLWNKADNDNLNDWLKALLKKSQIETYGKQVHFHTLRKFLYDTLSKKDETIAKVITAKKTSASDITYKTSLDSECQRIFRECYKDFALNGDVSGKSKREQTERIDDLENALRQTERENAAFKTRIDLIQQELSTIKQQVGYLWKEKGPQVKAKTQR